MAKGNSSIKAEREMTEENQSNIQSKREGFWSTKLESGMMQTERAIQSKKIYIKKKTKKYMGNINDRISPGRNFDGSGRASVDRRAYSRMKGTLPTGTNTPIGGKSGASWRNIWCWSARRSSFWS